MIIKNIIFIIIFPLSIESFCQSYIEYYNTINKAEIAHIDKMFVESDSLYKIAFSLVKHPFKEDFFLAAKNANKLKNNVKTKAYLKESILRGLTLKRIKKSRKEFKFFLKSKSWKDLKNKFSDLRNKFLEGLKLDLREEIHNMIKKDQAIRAPIFGNGNKMSSVDDINYHKLLKIIEENNNKWPGFSIIGESTTKGKYNVTDNIAILPLHFNKQQIEVLKPYMLEAVLNGEMYPYHYARIIDYRFYKDNLNIVDNESKNKSVIKSCVLYGSYLNTKICNCKKAEEERKKIGFEPLKDYYRKRKSKYECIDN